MLSLNNKKEDSGLKILILISGGAQIRRHICIVDLYRWLLKVETLDGWVKANKLDGNNKAIVLSDMLSDSIEYKNRRSAQLICDPKSILIFSIISLHRDPKYIQIFFYKSICIMLSLNRKKEDSGLKILILISGGAQIRRHICIVDLYR